MATDAQALRPCPACGEGRTSIIGSKASFRVGRCAGCSTLLVVDGVEPSADFYDNWYGGNNVCVPAFVEHRVDEIVAEFEPFRRTGRLLDVGCGAGTVLRSAQRAGWECTGVEIAPRAVEDLRRDGFAVHLGPLATAAFEDEQFDVVVAIELLEHVADPFALLREIARVLRTGGRLYATTPHCKGVSVRTRGLDSSLVCPPEHLQLLSSRGARTLVERAGFCDVSLKTRGVNPSEVIGRFRRRSRATDAPHRVRSSYALNEALTRTAPRRALKGAANGMLRILRLGDSLQIRAVRGPAR